MKIKIAHYPQLRSLSWNRRPDGTIEEVDALALYERNWHYVDQQNISADEKALIDRLVNTYGFGVLNV